MSNQKVEHHKVAIVGTGFSGLGMAIRLRQQGEQDFILFEKEGGVGGTWRVNHYPGCACDVPSHLYSFSFAPKPNWSRMFAPQPEIKEYLEYCASHYGIMLHVRLNTALTGARWNEQQAHWEITDQYGNHYTATYLVSGAGGLSVPVYPNIPGLDQFKGRAFHSQNWDHDYDLRGKRVAVIGTGASAIQFVPEVQKQAAQLDLYQRTPPWIIPKPDRAMSLLEKLLFKRLPAAQKALRERIYWTLETRVLGMLVDPRLMAIAKRWALNHIRRQIRDPQLRKKVSPDYTIGCKRILLSDNYYPALDQPNVDVITTGIREVTADGVIDVNGTKREVDAIIYGTGFKATDPIPRGLFFGRGGVDIVDTWPEGPEAYKGTTVSGFPNFFMLMGPNTGLGHNSMVYMIESQVNYALKAMEFMEQKGIRMIDVAPSAQAEYNQRLQSKLQGSVWNNGGCQSWYLHPVSGRNVTLWPGFTWQFRQQTRRFDPGAYLFNGAVEASAAGSVGEAAA
ncbi:MAG: NAD(P)/FAD-dependent oxidoreductase [Pseudomonadota bacterium]|nr:NAD(P)/FAD-dependent oxidoreductase [Pseudomonadota bacterium]